MNQYGTSSFEPQRVTVAAFYAEVGELILDHDQTKIRPS